ncbi:MAG: FtsK/SpoIIIE domain-containing protein, partial [Chloroflexota bacterium]|nr:FtsK/SpoIIIE domain-containing protein [Chloroflexota bacterium]
MSETSGTTLTEAQKASWAAHFARRALTLMRNESVLRQAADGQLHRGERGALICVAWPREDRVVLLINPYVVDQNKLLGSKFQHSLRTVMHGHRTVVTNSRGIFFQVGYLPEPLDAGSLPTRVTLDLSGVPSGDLMVPLGVTRRGEKWVSLLDADSVLIGGTRQMGKTTLLHAWILSLITAETPEKLRLFLCDGKNKAEFGRYAGIPHVHAVAGRGNEMGPIIGRLREELTARSAILRKHGARNVRELRAQYRPPFLVLIVDELAEALTADGVEEALRDLVSLGGAYGVLPVLATQRPDSSVVAGFLKCNLATRISLPVPASQDSRVILGRTGAEKIAKRKGRIVLEWAGRMVEAQAYDVPTPMLNETLDRLAAGEPVGDPPLALEAWQTRLVRTSLEQLDGNFNIRKLAKLAGISRKKVERLAPRWETQGLLTPAGADAAGRRTSRRVTRRLRDL